MKTLLKSDRLYQGIFYNYSLVVEMLCKKCDSFYLYCFYDFLEYDDLLNVASNVLSVEPYRVLKNSFVSIELHEQNDLRLKFKVDKSSKNWLLTHNGFESFNVNYIEATLDDLEFVDVNNNTLLRYDKFYSELYINDKNEFIQELNEELSKLIHRKQAFITEFTEVKCNQSDEVIVRHFSSDKYGIEYFIEYLKYKEHKEYMVNEFYLNAENIEFCIKIIIDKLYKKYDLRIALMLLDFYAKDCLDNNEVNYSTNDIDRYILSLEKNIVVELFNADILLIKNLREGCAIMDKIIELSSIYGLIDISSNLILPPKFSTAWHETYCVKEVKINWKLLIKKESLLSLFISYFHREPIEVREDLKRNMNNENLNYRDIHKAAYGYFYGIILQQDYKKAMDLFIILSKIDSNIDCQYDLACCYLNGWGTVKDLEQAKYWFRKAAENGHPKAPEQLDLINKG